MNERTYPIPYPETDNTEVEPMISLLNYYFQLKGTATDEYVCTLLTFRIPTLDDLENDDWTTQTISDALEIAHEDDFSNIVDAARIAFDDDTEYGHAAHIRDALRENLTRGN